jgi:hypothetical protein
MYEEPAVELLGVRQAGYGCTIALTSHPFWMIFIRTCLSKDKNLREYRYH